MLDQLLKELKDTWGYDTEELNDIREKMGEVANSAFWEGYDEASCTKNKKIYSYRHDTGFVAYGKPEDFQ
jgi:hypothetical protein